MVQLVLKHQRPFPSIASGIFLRAIVYVFIPEDEGWGAHGPLSSPRPHVMNAPDTFEAAKKILCSPTLVFGIKSFGVWGRELNTVTVQTDFHRVGYIECKSLRPLNYVRILDAMNCAMSPDHYFRCPIEFDLHCSRRPRYQSSA